MALYILIAYFILFPLVIIAELAVIIDKINIKKQIEVTTPRTIRRKHTNIQKSNYSNAFNRRGEQKTKFDYSKYKNSNGLYAPVKPKEGIEISKEEE